MVAAFLLAAVPSTAASDTKQEDLSPNGILTRMQSAYAALSSYSDEAKIASTVNGKMGPKWQVRIKVSRPNLYRVEWYKEESEPNSPAAHKGIALWSQGDGVYATNEKGTVLASASILLPFIPADMADIPYAFFEKTGPYFPLSSECCAGAKYMLSLDEKIGDVDCYVLRGGEMGRGGDVYTLWIGKSDFLLRQIQRASRAGTSTETHSNIVMNVPMSRSDFAASSPN